MLRAIPSRQTAMISIMICLFFFRVYSAFYLVQLLFLESGIAQSLSSVHSAHSLTLMLYFRLLFFSESVNKIRGFETQRPRAHPFQVRPRVVLECRIWRWCWCCGEGLRSGSPSHFATPKSTRVREYVFLALELISSKISGIQY